MPYSYLVTTDIFKIPDGCQIVMVDGTVPKWQPGSSDLHFDHHRIGGSPVQILEIPQDTEISHSACFVTTQIDADACCAAAWLRLLASHEIKNDLAKRRLIAIAYDCDHLGCPSEYADLADFARNAVATLKQSAKTISQELGLPVLKKDWLPEQKILFDSTCFQAGVEWLYNAALKLCEWPGEKGEAIPYWVNYIAEKSGIWARCYSYKNVGILDSRGINGYVDPRHLIEWVREQKSLTNVTLTVRDRLAHFFHTEEELFLWDSENCKDSDNSWKISLPAYNYTLGSVPLHGLGSPKFNEHNIWEKLSEAEHDKRYFLNLPKPSTDWGGRNEVGGSSWNDPALLLPEEVIDCVLKNLEK